ncbi:putative addiction module component, TIGR02574 family [Mucilaginibacter sp. OK268]|uniref:addiction module protein n=1 Tax=Mucilaginibacter sp. OK268 TaxID=1881048 RepID=UPI0008873673|nr:addiction module protein [Mucilaginibacter sp. OK268]SDP62435.1 putative addiction module component, TIGR02574 family [Mucilaginibacter sp. OK268]
MSTEIIRERLHEYIRFADDKKVEAIYTMVENEIIEELDLWEDKAFLNELKDRLDEYESGKVTGSGWEEVKQKARDRKS